MQDNDPADYLSRHWQTGSNEIRSEERRVGKEC